MIKKMDNKCYGELSEAPKLLQNVEFLLFMLALED